MTDGPTYQAGDGRQRRLGDDVTECAEGNPTDTTTVPIGYLGDPHTIKDKYDPLEDHLAECYAEGDFPSRIVGASMHLPASDKEAVLGLRVRRPDRVDVGKLVVSALRAAGFQVVGQAMAFGDCVVGDLPDQARCPVTSPNKPVDANSIPRKRT